MQIPKLKTAALVTATFLAALPALAADSNNSQQQQQGSAVVTVLPKSEVPGGISQDALHLKIDGKNSTITGWTPLRGAASRVEMVVLIDNGARQDLSLQYKEISKFIQVLPPDSAVAVAYMENGRAVLAGPLTTDRTAVARELHIPMAGIPGVSASPYFCLSDLAKHWPSNDVNARREVVMLTDGVDYYNPRYDPNDPYVQAAITDSVKNHLVVYSIYWRSTGRFDRTGYANFTGQNLLSEVTAATGGENYWQGYGNPVSLEPYLSDINRRLDNQYELRFITPINGKPQMASLKLNIAAEAKVDAPQQVYVHPAAE
ncbi:MAG TPA: hypothetical protein VMT38_12650 [Terracidiphilus sp.]|nr:hypothetical protein [Terracidiphilus sp.]